MHLQKSVQLLGCISKLIDCSYYLVDNKDQINFLIDNKTDLEKCYFGSFKSVFDLEYAISKGINKFIIASIYEFNLLINTKHLIDKIFLMIDTSIILCKEKERFGLSLNEVITILENPIWTYKIDGLSFHLQNNTKTLSNYSKLIEILLPLVSNYKLKLNMGGIPYPYLEKLIIKHLNLRKCKVIVEPGNSLFADATTIETRVTYIDVTNKIINLNIGIYSGLLDYKLLNTPLKIWQYNNDNSNMEKFKVFGPSSDNLDYLGEHFFSLATTIGDKVYISNCGIYSIFLNTSFYSKKILIDII